MCIKKEGRSKRRTGLTLGTEMIEILVGPDKEKFNMHKDRVCELSGYFRGLLKGNFNDADDGTTTLKEENVEGFKLFQHCVYNNSFPDDVDDIEEITGNENTLEVIVQFYVLADQLILENRFKLQAIRTFTTSILPSGILGGNTCGLRLSARDINPALLLLPEHDPFLKLLIDITAYQYLKRNAQIGLYGYHQQPEFAATKAEVDHWMEGCIADVPTGRVARLFSAVAEFTKGWCNSRVEAGELNKALMRGVESEQRYWVGFLKSEMSLEELAAADDGERDVKRVRLEDGSE